MPETKLIHRLWLGPKAMPAEYVAFGRKWLELNQEWVVIHWDEYAVNSYVWTNQKIYDGIAKPQENKTFDPIAAATQQADVLAYEIVQRFGGLYVNVDMEPVQSLDSLFQGHPELLEKDAVFMEDQYWVNNGVMWSPKPGSAFYTSVIDELPNWYDPDKMMHLTTGPHLLTSMAYANRSVEILDKDFFNPIHYSAVQEGQGAKFKNLPAKTIAVHHWGHKKNGRAHQVNS